MNKSFQQDDLEYKEYSYNEPTKDLPLKIFESPPPYGKRIVTLQIEVEGADKASLVFAGRIYEYPGIVVSGPLTLT